MILVKQLVALAASLAAVTKSDAVAPKQERRREPESIDDVLRRARESRGKAWFRPGVRR